eukprot:TRINITY_DN36583_c0_g1_i1.p1 TRINITY_DN36583_c0_g1~~TRINITY_DN36583_c0_g1_i1.p1  ORF type:complete len:724 (-),score=147.73 TRINITY_DN36583_c0_g1_i1:26-2116(-)
MEFDPADWDENDDIDLDNLPPDLQALLSKDGGASSSVDSKTESWSIPTDIQSLAARSRINMDSRGSCGLGMSSGAWEHLSAELAQANASASSPSAPARSPSPDGGFEWRVDFDVLRRSNTLAAGLPEAVKRSARKIEREGQVVAQIMSRGCTPASGRISRESHLSLTGSGRISALASRVLCCASASSTRVAASSPIHFDGTKTTASEGVPAPNAGAVKPPTAHPPPAMPSNTPRNGESVEDIAERLLMETIKDDDVDHILQRAPASAPRRSGREHGATGFSLNAPRGLVNVGNTCFLNAAIQALGHCVPLTAYFLQGLFVTDLNEANPLSTGGVVTMVYAALMHELFALRPVRHETPSGSAAPTPHPPLDLLLAVAKFHPFLASGEMHDAQELLAWLLGAMHEDLNRVRKRSTSGQAARQVKGGGQLPELSLERCAAEAWQEHLKKNRSVIVDLFQGQLRSQLRCPQCHAFSVTFDPFLHMSLPLPPAEAGGWIALADAVSLFCQEEALDSENGWTCHECGQRVPAVKKLDLWKLPQILVVHLKRFEWVQETLPGGFPFFHVRKLGCHVDLPQEGLDLGALCAAEAPQKEPLIYDLVATVDHHGTSAEVGHYTAACRRPEGWIRFDDAHTLHIDADSPVVGPQNYILLFQRRGTPGEPGAIAEQRASAPQSWPHIVDVDWSFLTGSAGDDDDDDLD